MTGNTHVAIGLASSAVIMTSIHEPPMVELIYGSMAAVVASTLPDADLIDNRSAGIVDMIANVIEYSGLPLYFYLYYAMFINTGMIHKYDISCPEVAVQEIARSVAYMSVYIQTNWENMGIHILAWLMVVTVIVVAPHRGYSHSIMFGSITTAAWYWMIPMKCTTKWFAIAYASHLIADLLNGTGESLLFPLPSKICFNICSASGWVSKMLMFAGALTYLVTLTCYCT